MISVAILPLIVILLNLLTTRAQNLEKSRSVWVEQGLLRGKIYKMGENFVQIFRGIPYAEPPVGPLRFKRPVKRKRWHQEYMALDYGAPCLQFMEFHRHDRYSGLNMENESEDCLFLNVFSPYDLDDESKLFPVLVWIHGGSFLSGSSDTGIDMEVIAKNLVFNGIVLVTLNYRLGPLGFLNYQDGDKVEGNFGIWDQVLALQWIQANMKQLNGDPTRVTIMGESAGAAAVSILAVSPITVGLAQQVIELSGSSTAGWAVHRFGQSAYSAENIAAYVSCERQFSAQTFIRASATQPLNTECNLQEKIPECIANGGEMESAEIVECFREELNLSSPLFRYALANELGISKMVVDGELITYSGQEFIRDNARIPLMVGVAENEWAHKKAQNYGLLRFENISLEDCYKNVRKIINEQYHTGCPQKLHNSTLELITNASFLRYLDSPNNNRTLPRIIFGLQDLESDVEFVASAQREIDAYVEREQPVYAFSFDYFPKSSIYEEERKQLTLFGRETVKVVRKEFQILRNHEPQAFHGLDHAFLFTRGYASNLLIDPFTKRDRLFSKMFTTMIANFVRNGNPTATKWNNFTWPMFTNESAQYASLDLPPKMMKGSLHWPATIFWNKEVTLLAKFALKEKGTPVLNEELTTEERQQLSAYRRAWWALWLLVAMIALVIWISVICIVVTRCRSPRAKPYNNIVVAR